MFVKIRKDKSEFSSKSTDRILPEWKKTCWKLVATHARTKNPKGTYDAVDGSGRGRKRRKEQICGQLQPIRVRIILFFWCSIFLLSRSVWETIKLDKSENISPNEILFLFILAKDLQEGYGGITHTGQMEKNWTLKYDYIEMESVISRSMARDYLFQHNQRL